MSSLFLTSSVCVAFPLIQHVSHLKPQNSLLELSIDILHPNQSISQKTTLRAEPVHGEDKQFNGNILVSLPIKMDIMESLGEDVDHFVFDCGEDDLDQCQEHFYFTKENDIAELVDTIKSCQSSIAGRRNEETRSSPSLETGGRLCAPSVKSAGNSTQPIVVQATTGVGNSQGYMILDPSSLRLVSSGNSLKLYTVPPNTVMASSSQSVVTPSSLAPLQTPFAPRTLHTLPQQLAPARFRPQIRALTPSALNTKVVNSSPVMLATSERSVAPGMGMQVNAPASSPVQKSPTTIPIQIKVSKPCPARFKIISRPTTVVSVPSPETSVAQYVPVVPQTTSAAQYVPAVSQAKNVVQFVPTATSVAQFVPAVSQTKSAVPFVPIATSVAQFVPKSSQATSVAKCVQLPQPTSKMNVARPLSTNVVKNMINDSSSSSPAQSSLPLLPVTRMSPPPALLHPPSKSNLSELLVQPNQTLPIQTPHKPPSNMQLPSNTFKPSSGKFGTSPEVLRGATSKNVTNGTKPSSPTALVDLTAEDNNATVPSKTESESISSSQTRNSRKSFVKEKTFPSLVVTARACMKAFPNAVATNERLQLDNQLRKALQMTPQMFTEHLLQQRLLRSEQHCKNHSKNLKLGMYSDSARFPHSGGYVWISECCNAGFCSVFSGSIFDKTLQPPATILKLMYHWSCNTAVHNVLQWVKVDNFIVKTYYTFFRAVCTAAVQEKMGLLGGAFKKVQVGVITLGTSEGQGKKDLKVDILAAQDKETSHLRLRALDNSAYCHTDDFYEKKLRRILETLQEWVHPHSTIITDFAVDLPLCRQYGFGNVIVSGGKSSTSNNLEIVGYLKNWVPKMFQNTLNLLSIQIIQQFLDELVWRELWGPIPSRAYDSLLNHISEITKLPGPDIITKLKKIASFPTKNWKFFVWKNPTDWNSVDKNSSEGEVSAPREPVPTAESLPLEQTSKAGEPLVSQDAASKLRMTLLKYKEAPSKSQKPNGHELAIRKPGTVPTRTNAASSVFDSKLRTSQPSTEDTFDIDDIIPLESYYYGYISGILKRQKYTGAFLAECALCKRDFLSGSLFTDHLIHHALNDSEAWAGKSVDHLMSVCKVCLLPVNDISSHFIRKHPKPVSSIPTACKICNVDHKSEERLFRHMSTVHCELDMPYSCEECQFRTSIYDDAASHFKDFHDKDSCVQCPFCLKVVRFCTVSGLEMTSNQHYFIQHIQKHNVAKLNRKCEKCMLSFTNMGILKSHQENFHTSGKNLCSAVRYNKDPLKFIKIKRPNAKPLPPVTLHESSFHTLKGKVLASIFKVDPSLSNFNCAECDSPLTQNHFSVKMTCTRCPFQSHCADAIKEHSARTHLTLDVLVSNLPQVMGGSPLLKKTLYCSKCTFSSINGNRMATHIAECIESAVATTEKRKLISLNGCELSDYSRKHRKYF